MGSFDRGLKESYVDTDILLSNLKKSKITTELAIQSPKNASPWTQLDRLTNLLNALKNVTLDGHYMEFGVWHGGSINFIANQVEDKIIYGFDSFRSFPTEPDLPEDSPVKKIWTRDFFNRDGKLPLVKSNVKLIPGWFEDTVPEFIKTVETTAFAHIDSDLYASAKTVLDTIGHTFKEGTILVFDEFLILGHEEKAFIEWLDRSEFFAHMIYYCDNYHQVTFKLSKSSDISTIEKI